MDVLPVGLDTREFAAVERRLKPGEPVRVLSVGRLVEIKGHENVLRAVGQLREQGRSVQLDLVGEGPLRGRLEAVVEELGLKDVVVFHGARTSVEVRELMAAAHLFVMASIQVEGDREGQGLVLQEAQASGLPVVATNHGALPEGMASERSGFLVPEGDVGELARRLGWLMDRPHLWGEMGANGRRFVEGKYEGSRLSGELVNIYERAMDSFLKT
jgi:colanic acid/amylovoran biosynthesis glycosyltransferase